MHLNRPRTIPPPWFMEKLSLKKVVPGAVKVRDRCCGRQLSVGPLLATISEVGWGKRGSNEQAWKLPSLWPAFSALLPHWIPWVRSPLCTLAHAVLHLECPSILPAPQECVLIFQYPAQMEAWLDSQAASLSLSLLPQHCLKAWVTAHILCCNYFLNVWQAPPPVNQAPVLIILISRNGVGCLVGLPSSV